MIRYLLTIALCALAALCQPAHAEDWLTVRKAEHLVGSAAISGLATHYTGSELEGFGIAFTIGLAKEEIDRYKRGRSIARGEQPHDALTVKALVADAVGSTIGAKLGGLTIDHDQHTTVIAYSEAF